MEQLPVEVEHRRVRAAWDIASDAMELLMELSNVDRWAVDTYQQDLKSGMGCKVPVASTAQPFDNGTYFRPDTEAGVMYIRGPAESVIGARGSEVFAKDLHGMFAAMDAFGTLNEEPLDKQRVPGALLLSEAMSQAEQAAAFQIKHLRRYGRLARVPVPLYVVIVPNEVQQEYTVALGQVMSRRSSSVVDRIFYQDRLAIFIYYYPLAPLSVQRLMEEPQMRHIVLEEGHVAFLEELSARTDVVECVQSWIGTLARMLVVGFCPVTLSQRGAGYVSDPAFAEVTGGFTNCASLQALSDLHDNQIFIASIFEAFISLVRTLQYFLTGPFLGVYDGSYSHRTVSAGTSASARSFDYDSIINMTFNAHVWKEFKDNLHAELGFVGREGCDKRLVALVDSDEQSLHEIMFRYLSELLPGYGDADMKKWSSHLPVHARSDAGGCMGPLYRVVTLRSIAKPRRDHHRHPALAFHDKKIVERRSLRKVSCGTPTWDVELAYPDLAEALNKINPHVMEEVAGLRQHMVAAKSAGTFELDRGAISRPPGHHRTFYCRIRNLEIGGQPCYIALKGTEILSDDLEAFFGVLRRTGQLESHPLHAQKIPGAVLVSEALEIARHAAEYQRSHLGRYGYLAPVPIPLLVVTWSPKTATDYISKITPLLSKRAGSIVQNLVNFKNSLAAYIYYLPMEPKRISGLVEEFQPLRSALIHDGWRTYHKILERWCDPAGTLKSWITQIARQMCLGFFPLSKHYRHIGYSVSPRSMTIGGGIIEMESLCSMDEIGTEEFFWTFWTVCVEAVRTIYEFLVGAFRGAEGIHDRKHEVIECIIATHFWQDLYTIMKAECQSLDGKVDPRLRALIYAGPVLPKINATLAILHPGLDMETVRKWSHAAPAIAVKLDLDSLPPEEEVASETGSIGVSTPRKRRMRSPLPRSHSNTSLKGPHPRSGRVASKSFSPEPSFAGDPAPLPIGRSKSSVSLRKDGDRLMFHFLLDGSLGPTGPKGKDTTSPLRRCNSEQAEMHRRLSDVLEFS